MSGVDYDEVFDRYGGSHLKGTTPKREKRLSGGFNSTKRREEFKDEDSIFEQNYTKHGASGLPPLEGQTGSTLGPQETVDCEDTKKESTMGNTHTPENPFGSETNGEGSNVHEGRSQAELDAIEAYHRRNEKLSQASVLVGLGVATLALVGGSWAAIRSLTGSGHTKTMNL